MIRKLLYFSFLASVVVNVLLFQQRPDLSWLFLVDATLLIIALYFAIIVVGRTLDNEPILSSKGDKIFAGIIYFQSVAASSLCLLAML